MDVVLAESSLLVLVGARVTVIVDRSSVEVVVGATDEEVVVELEGVVDALSSEPCLG